MYARNTDGMNNSGGMIQHQIKLALWIQGRMATQDFYVLNLGGRDNNILGYPWLTKYNPWINWEKGEVHMIGTLISRHNELEVVEQRYLLRYLGACQQHNLRLAATICWQQRRRAILQWVLGDNHLSLRKLTLSTTLAQAAKKVEQKLPPQSAQYAKVFNEPKQEKSLPNNLSIMP